MRPPKIEIGASTSSRYQVIVGLVLQRRQRHQNDLCNLIRIRPIGYVSIRHEDIGFDQIARMGEVGSQAADVGQRAGHSAIEIFEEAAELSDDGKIFERLSYLYLEDDQFDRCVDAASGALDKGGLRKVQSVHIVKGMCLFNQNKLSTARTSFTNCRRVARAEDDKANQRVCGSWITFIDRESKRQELLSASSG